MMPYGDSHPAIADAAATFRAFVNDPRFPCVAAKGAVRAGGCEVQLFGALGSRRTTRDLGCALAAFACSGAPPTALRAFAAIFPASHPADEVKFEQALWAQLQGLSDREGVQAAWDPSVSDDPANADFSFSVAGHAMFVIGMHPSSSRRSRRFHWPTLVFNPRAQFDRLRRTGHFVGLQHKVREREIALQGSLNPNLADFGERSDARQYSGRPTEAEWQCPFHRNRE